MFFSKILKKLKGDTAQGEVSDSMAGVELSNALMAISQKKQIQGVAHISSEAISELNTALDELIRIMKEEFAGKLDNPMRSFDCKAGAFGEGASGVHRSRRTPYLFLRVPGRPGFLLEELETEIVTLFRASESRSLLWNEGSAQVDGNPLFTRKAKHEGVFTRVNPDLWEVMMGDFPRTTLSTFRLAENLLAKAVQEMGTD